MKELPRSVGAYGRTSGRLWPPQVLLGLIVGLYLVLGGVYTFTSPTFEKPDEEWHFAYVAFLIDHGALPPLVSDQALNPAQAIAGHPPLYYALGAVTLRLLGLGDRRPQLSPNPYWAYPAPGTANDNKARFVHPRSEWAQPEFQAAYALRLLSLALGAGTVVCAYGLAGALGCPLGLRLASALLVACLPQFLFIASSVSNDALVSTLSSAALWALIAALQRPAARASWILFGALSGLAALTKTNALLVPATGVAVAIGFGFWRRSPRIALIGALVTVGGWLAICGWWYARNQLLFGDAFGLRLHLLGIGQRDALSLSLLVGLWARAEVTFWAAFGWYIVLLPRDVYGLLRVIEVCAAIGLCRFAWHSWRAPRRWSPQRPAALAASGLYVVGMAAAFFWWSYTSGVVGRLLFPTLAPMAAFLVIGWAELWRPLPIITLALLATLAVLSPYRIAAAYQPPRLLPALEAPAGARPTQIDFGQVARLYAASVAPRRLAPRAQADITLCWQARQATSTNYSVFVHLLGADNRPLGQRDTYPGLGSYATTLWRPGDAFCDQYAVPVAPDTAGPVVGRVEVGLYDLQSGRRLPATDAAGNQPNAVIVGQVKITGPGASLPADAARLEANFGDQIALLGYTRAAAAQPGAALPLKLFWQARSQPAADYTVFVHLSDAMGQLAAQDDAAPEAGQYPTSWWDNGEIVADAHRIMLPASLLPGVYHLRVGLYQLDSGERLQLVGSSDDSVDLGTIMVGP